MANSHTTIAWPLSAYLISTPDGTDNNGSSNYLSYENSFYSCDQNAYGNSKQSNFVPVSSLGLHNETSFSQQYYYQQMDEQVSFPSDEISTQNTPHSNNSTSAIKDICLSHKHVVGAVKSISELSSKADELTSGISSTASSNTKIEKPPYSYIALICMALADSPTKKCTLREIVDYIKGKFAYYKQSQKLQTAIRHNLTLNDCFKKSGRRLGDTGCLWALDPAYEDMFKHGSLQRRRYRLKEGRIDKYRRNKSKKIKQASTISKTSTPVRTSSRHSMNSDSASPSSISNDSRSSISINLSDVSSSPCGIASKDNCSFNTSSVPSLNNSLITGSQFSLDLEAINKLPLDQFEFPSILETISLSDNNGNAAESSVYCGFNQSASVNVPQTELRLDSNFLLSFDTGYFSV